MVPVEELGLLTFLAFFTTGHTSTRVVQLYGAKPEGGFWAVEVDVRREGKSDYLDNPPLADANFKIGGSSYDPVSRHIALETYEPHGFAFAPLCNAEKTKKVTTFVTNLTTFAAFSTEAETNCLECQAAPFAFHGSKIYFLLVGDFGYYPNITKRVQLRVMDSCDKCQHDTRELLDDLEVFGTPKLFNCSHVIATVYAEVPINGEEISLRTGKQLKISADQYGLSYFFQFFIERRQNSRHSIDLNMYHVTPGSDVTLLRTEKVHSRYAQWNIRGIASVDYKDGVLCWTAADRLYCGKYDGRGRLSEEKMLLIPGEGASTQVCTGETLDLLPIVTGVAIAETGDKTTVFFGCYPQWPGLGGVGMIRLHYNWRKKRIHPLRVGDNMLIAGSLVALRESEEDCKVANYKPEVCTELPGEWPLDDDPEQEDASHNTGGNDVPYNVIEHGNEVKGEPDDPSALSNSTEKVMAKGIKSSSARVVYYNIAMTAVFVVGIFVKYN